MPADFLKRLSLAARILTGGRLPPDERRESIPPITLEEVAEIKGFFPREKFFIYGHARSGTTLLTRLIRQHPEVHCNYQAHFFTRPPLLKSLVADPQVGEWLSRRSNRWNRGRDLSPVVLRATADFIMERDAAREGGKRIVGDKSPNSLLDGEAVRLLHAVYPDARLIFIVRDGRDAALSHRFQAFIDSPQHLNAEDLRIRQAFSQAPEPFLRGERSLFTEKGIHQAAASWVHNVAETDRVGQEIFGGQYISLRYEDMLAEPFTALCRLWGFLGADLALTGLAERVAAEMSQNPDAEWQQQKAGDLAAPLQKKGKHGGWREMFTPRDLNVFARLAGETLQAWRYPAE